VHGLKLEEISGWLEVTGEVVGNYDLQEIGVTTFPSEDLREITNVKRTSLVSKVARARVMPDRKSLDSAR